MDEHTQRQYETGNAVSNKFYNHEQLRQESKQKQEAAQKTHAEHDKKGFDDFKGSQKDYDNLYKYSVGKSLKENQGKPLTPDNDTKIAQKFIEKGASDDNKLREAIKNHSPVAARLPEEKRHEYAGGVVGNAHKLHLANTSREENTRVPTHRAPEHGMSQDELEMMRMIKEMGGRN